MFKNKSILITGGTGSFGQRLVEFILKKHPEIKKIIILSRDEFIDSTRLPMSKGIYDFAIDVAGGKTLSAILASMKYNGLIVCCGNVGARVMLRFRVMVKA